MVIQWLDRHKSSGLMHSMMQQARWGVSFPDFEMLAKACQLVSFTIGKNDDVKEAIHATISEEPIVLQCDYLT